MMMMQTRITLLGGWDSGNCLQSWTLADSVSQAGFRDDFAVFFSIQL